MSTDSAAEDTSYGYDALGRLKTRVSSIGNPDQETTTYSYDEARTGFFNVGKGDGTRFRLQ